MNSNMAKQKKELDKIVKDTSAEKSVIENLVKDKMENFVKMIEFNNVQENDLSNYDNKLYQKLLQKSKLTKAGENLNTPDAMYQYEVATSAMMRNPSSMTRKENNKFSDQDNSILIDKSNLAGGISINDPDETYIDSHTPAASPGKRPRI